MRREVWGLGSRSSAASPRLHGGAVEASARVRARQPFHRDAAAGTAESLPVRTHGGDRSPGPARSSRCLVVEDNVDAAHMLELALKLGGNRGSSGLRWSDAVRVGRRVQARRRPPRHRPASNEWLRSRACDSRQLPGLRDVHIIAVMAMVSLRSTKGPRRGVRQPPGKPVELDALLKVPRRGRGDHRRLTLHGN